MNNNTNSGDVIQFPHNTRPYPDLQSALDAIASKHILNGEPLTVFYRNEKKEITSFVVVGNDFPGASSKHLILGLDRERLGRSLGIMLDGGVIDLTKVFDFHPDHPHHDHHSDSHHHHFHNDCHAHDKFPYRSPESKPYYDIEKNLREDVGRKPIYDENLSRSFDNSDETLTEYDYDEMDYVEQ